MSEIKNVEAGLSCEIRKVDSEKRLVTAWAGVVTKSDGSAVVDFQNDVIRIEVLEQAVNKAFAGGSFAAGEMHERTVGRVVQALTLSKSEREALGFGVGPEGLVVKLHVDDDAAWARVKSGELRELSIGGSAQRFEVAA